MIDLGVPARVVQGVTLYADHARPHHLHAVPSAPRLARDESGRPAFSLVRLIRDGQLSRGLLECTVECGFASGELDAIRNILREETGDDTLSVGPLLPRSVQAELFFVTPRASDAEGTGPLAMQPLNEVTAHFLPPHTAPMRCQLNPDATTLVEAAIRTGGAPVGLRYSLEVEALRPARRVVARIEWGRVYDHVSEHARRGSFVTVSEMRRLVESLVEDRVIDITAVEGPDTDPSDAETSVAQIVDWVQRELVERFARPVLELSREPATVTLGAAGEIFGVGSAYEFKAITQIERATTTLDFQRPDAIVRTTVLQTHLADAWAGASADEHIADVEPGSPFFDRMRFTLGTVRTMDASFVHEVVGQWRWGPHAQSLRLVPEAPSATVEDWADASPDGTWELALAATMAPDAPVHAGSQFELPPVRGTERTLAVDLHRALGLRKLVVAAPVGVDDLLAVRCDVQHVRDSETLRTVDVMVTPASPEVVVWLTGWLPGDRIDIRPTWLMAPSRVVVGDAIRATTEVVPLPPPITWRTVQVVSDSDWTGLSTIAVDIAGPADDEAGAGATQSVITLDFAQPDQTRVVRIERGDGGDNSFRYRTTKVLDSGVVEREDWVTTDVSVLFVGRHSAFVRRLELVTVGAELPQAGVRLIEVDLEYIDPQNAVRHLETAVFESRSQTFVWTVPIVDASRRDVTYTVTLHALDGRTVRRPRVTTTERLVPIPTSLANTI